MFEWRGRGFMYPYVEVRISRSEWVKTLEF